jgi:hypothetical protein
MIDLLDLMNEKYKPSVTKHDTLLHLITFINESGTHQTQNNISLEQMKILKDNAYMLYRKLNAFL